MVADYDFPKRFGRYILKKLIAKGGMGEVFLAYDTICDRHVALKKIRPDLLKYKNSPIRFVQEAKIAAKLSHPSIIPIFDIIQTEDQTYYTMSYIEGESLRDILSKTIETLKTSTISHPVGGSIFSLSQIFLQVCQAIAFSHSNGILHRDIKPGNIMIGNFGQVLLLDWGLAKAILDTSTEDESDINIQQEGEDLTRPGKAVGTLSFLAPERAVGNPASVRTDIYSLGVVLYQLLTLKLPFKRQSLKDFKQTARFEKLIDPIEMAPYRDIPIQLSQIAKKCLQFNPKDRYGSVDELIEELKNYIEGKPDWIFQTDVSIYNPHFWEFQENVLVNKQLAITRSSYMMEWVALMISKSSYSGNIKMSIDLEIERHGQGVGFLFSIPEKNERTGLEDGFCLWAGSKKNPGFKLFRSNVELLSFPEQALKFGKIHKIEIEKIDHKVKVFLDGESLLHYVGYIPIVGTHIGLLSKDTDFKILNWQIFTGSQNAMVNCLSIPDAFLASKDFKKAFLEYQRIADSFKGRNEGREALFRSGITLLEEGKQINSKKRQQYFFDLAHLEFENLKNTNGAPLEYLGKSLIYKYQLDYEEETKCLELSLRKFPKNPLINRIKEEMVFRLHECAKISRSSTYIFALLVLRHIPKVQMQKETVSLLENIRKNLDIIPFQKRLTIEKPDYILAIQLAFWLNKPEILIELALKKMSSLADQKISLSLCLMSLLHLKHIDKVNELIELLEKDEIFSTLTSFPTLDFTKKLTSKTDSLFTTVKWILDNYFNVTDKINFIEYLVLYEIPYCSYSEIKEIYDFFVSFSTSLENFSESIDLIKIELLLRLKNFDKCKELFEKYSSELKLPYSPFYTLHGIYSYSIGDEKEILNEYKQLFQLPYPPLCALFAHYLSGYITNKSEWLSSGFFYEKIQLFHQLELLFYSSSKKSKHLVFKKKFEKLIK